MNVPKKFEEYLKEGKIIKIKKDEERAKFLIAEAKISLKGLKRRIEIMGIDKFNANSIIKDCYDIIMEIIRANMLKRGYKSSGLYAHEAEVSFLRILKFKEEDVNFVNKLRFFRNSIIYYGKLYDIEYAKKVSDFTFRFCKNKKLFK